MKKIKKYYKKPEICVHGDVQDITKGLDGEFTDDGGHKSSVET